MHQRVDLLGVRVSAVTPQLAVEEIQDWIRRGTRQYVCVAPVSTLVNARRDPEYQRVINKAGMVTPDGMPVVWLLRSKGYRYVQRTYGPDLMKKLCNTNGLRHFFFGGTTEVMSQLEECLKKDMEGINIVGMIAPPFREQARVEDEALIRQINASGADILWVGLGSPKQDFWMTLNRDAINVPVIIGVGAAFDFLSGIKKQAPKWMRSIGLEWFFRLCCEPRRLWKRYLIGNSFFIYYVIQDMFHKKDK